MSSGGGYILSKQKFINDNLELCDEGFEKIFKRINSFKDNYSNNYFKRSVRRIFTHILNLNKRNEPRLYDFDIFKFNEIEAFLILNQLENLEKIIKCRVNNAKIWKKKLLNKFKQLHFIDHDHSIYNKLYILNDSKIDFRKYFILNAIEIEDGYKPLHLRYDFNKYSKTDLINTNLMWKKIFSLPTRQSIKENYLKRIIYNLT